MLQIDYSEQGTIRLAGRFDASQEHKARQVFSRLVGSCEVNFEALEYISSAGLSVLLETQRRLDRNGHALRLVDMRPPIRNVFAIAGFDAVFDIR